MTCPYCGARHRCRLTGPHRTDCEWAARNDRVLHTCEECHGVWEVDVTGGVRQVNLLSAAKETR